MQNTSKVLMIRPCRFAFNSQTAVNNTFQTRGGGENIQENALREFDKLVTVLREAGVTVIMEADTPEPDTPDAVFPNNWISFHPEHTICLYPMFAPNRRLERKPALIERLKATLRITTVADLTWYEKQDRFLEGTGSMVLDRTNRLAYVCRSPRSSETVLEEFCNRMGYAPVLFNAYDAQGQPIYHTNVMMCVADRYAVICLESIPQQERNLVAARIAQTGKVVIPISLEQVARFAGNMLQLKNTAGEKLLAMSTQALGSLSASQLETLRSFNRIVHSPIPTIETNGGGSVRCMIAEIFLGINLFAAKPIRFPKTL